MFLAKALLAMLGKMTTKVREKRFRKCAGAWQCFGSYSQAAKPDSNGGDQRHRLRRC